jgi:arginine deiminase
MAATAPHYALEQAQHAAEARHRMAINMVPLAPGVVVIPAGNPVTFAASEVRRVTCLEVEVDELVKGAGSVHCMTGVIHCLKEVA